MSFTQVSQQLLAPPVRTPLIRHRDIWVKSESGQRSGSAKYRMVYAKLRQAIEAGVINASTTLVEVSSGSTGVALADAGRQLGLRVEVLVHASAVQDKCDKMRQLGAKVMSFPVSTPVQDLIARVRRWVRQGGVWHLNQYDHVTTPPAYATMATEIVEQLLETDEPPPAYFACPVGTGGLIQGVGGPLNVAFPAMKIIAIEPVAGASIDGMRNTSEFHMGENDPYDCAFPDQRVTVPPPSDTGDYGGLVLSDSGRATLEWVRRNALKDVLVIAP